VGAAFVFLTPLHVLLGGVRGGIVASSCSGVFVVAPDLVTGTVLALREKLVTSNVSALASDATLSGFSVAPARRTAVGSHDGRAGCATGHREGNKLRRGFVGVVV